MSAPQATKMTKELIQHGHKRQDPYYWLNERENPAVREYLEKENAFTTHISSRFQDQTEEVYSEIRSRLKEDESSAPFRFRDYEYWSAFEVGESYPRLFRKRLGSDENELLLDQVAMAKNQSFFQLGDWALSENQQLLAFAQDTQGRRLYDLYIKNLETGEIVDGPIPHTSGEVEWANDNKHLFYTKRDPQTLRSYKVMRHLIGTDWSQDVEVFEERDPQFFVGLSKTKDRKYLLIESAQTESSEVRFWKASEPLSVPQVFHPREDRLLYEIEHHQDRFFVAHNFQAPNFQIQTAPAQPTPPSQWKDWLPHRSDVFIDDIEVFENFIVIEERYQGLIQLRVLSPDQKTDYHIQFPEPAYLASVGSNAEFSSSTLRYVYTSMTTPQSVYDFDMISKERQLIKKQEVLGDFDSARYHTDRLLLPARDGTRIPVSLVYSKKAKAEGPAPLLLYGYGSYGHSLDASFSLSRLSLLDRGFVFAIAHVRGGEEMGRHWYDQGKLFQKKNSFTDFIDVAENLIREQWTQTDRLYAMGGSAGGLLMGAVINMRPDLFNGVVADVPFVDVVTTMLDDTIPLTTFEYEEWGNPHDKSAYEYMLSYSPYDNVKAQDYPHLLVMTGLHDSQVQYWEPAKWVAKLRDLKTDDHLLLLKTNMEAGHGGASGRFESLKEIAFEYSFLLYLEELRKTKE